MTVNLIFFCNVALDTMDNQMVKKKEGKKLVFM